MCSDEGRWALACEASVITTAAALNGIVLFAKYSRASVARPVRGTGKGVKMATMFPERETFLRLEFDDLDVVATAQLLAAREPSAPFEYVVTPNVDHMQRMHNGGEDVAVLYREAWLCLNDSRILALLASFCGVKLQVAPGSDLTEYLFENIIEADEPITVIGADEASVAKIREKYQLAQLNHYNPPMGFANSDEEIDVCLDFIAKHPARLVFLCVGSPRQEMLAYKAKASNNAVGTGLCVGASLLFIAGTEKRAPLWMRNNKIEWLYRLMQDPRRLWRRYVFGGFAIARIYWRSKYGGVEQPVINPRRSR